MIEINCSPVLPALTDFVPFLLSPICCNDIYIDDASLHVYHPCTSLLLWHHPCCPCSNNKICTFDASFLIVVSFHFFTCQPLSSLSPLPRGCPLYSHFSSQDHTEIFTQPLWPVASLLVPWCIVSWYPYTLAPPFGDTLFCIILSNCAGKGLVIEHFWPTLSYVFTQELGPYPAT